MSSSRAHGRTDVGIPFAGFHLDGELVIPSDCVGVVLFAHGSGSSRHSPRNQSVAQTLRSRGIGTLLFDLLSASEEQEDRLTGHLRFNLGLLAERLQRATAWLHQTEPDLPVGYFGASTGGGAALIASVHSLVPIRAIVSRGGRPDLAGAALPKVKAPTLLIVGGEDAPVVEMNRTALGQMTCPRELRLIPGATHLFEEPGALAQVAEMAADWLRRHFGRAERGLS